LPTVINHNRTFAIEKRAPSHLFSNRFKSSIVIGRLSLLPGENYFFDFRQVFPLRCLNRERHQRVGIEPARKMPSAGEESGFSVAGNVKTFSLRCEKDDGR
jgi:hypothetical protein